MPRTRAVAAIVLSMAVTAALLAAVPAAAAPFATIAVGSTPSAVEFTPSGSKAVVTNQGDRSLSIIDVATSTVERRVTLLTEPRDVTVSSDGLTAWVVGWDHERGSSIEAVTIATGAKRTSTTVAYQPQAIGLHEAHGVAYAVSKNGYVTLVHMSSLAFAGNIYTQIDGNHIVMSPDGNRAYVGTGENGGGTITVIDTVKGAVIREVGPGQHAIQFDVTPDGATIINPWSDGSVRALSTAFDDTTNQLFFDVGDYPSATAVTPVGSHAYITNPFDGTVSVIDVGNRSVVDTITVGGSPQRVAVSPDGARVYVTHAEGYVTVIPRSDQTIPATVTTRVSGADRYETAALISKLGYPTGADTVWIATGQNYPDALAAAAAAARQNAPLLLVPQASLPSVVRTELERLSPTTIVVVGGEPSISSAVRTQLAGLADVPLVQLQGSDRYKTADRIVRYAFEASPPESVFLATGANFPDALSSGGIAGAWDAPVILVPGTSTAATPETVALFETLNVQHAVVVGGQPSITHEYLYSIWAPHWFDYERQWGGDRFVTSQNLNGFGFDSANTVYLATGVNFPDALAGAALAGAQDAPLYIVRPDCVPRRVLNDLARLDPSSVVLLGGTPSLSSGVKNLTPCA